MRRLEKGVLINIKKTKSKRQRAVIIRNFALQKLNETYSFLNEVTTICKTATK